MSFQVPIDNNIQCSLEEYHLAYSAWINQPNYHSSQKIELMDETMNENKAIQPSMIPRDRVIPTQHNPYGRKSIIQNTSKNEKIIRKMIISRML